MIYAMSDLHGCYEKYQKMLKAIDLKNEDTLYIVGDVVDRGEGGIEILKDMMQRENIIAIRGNHDFMAHYLLKQVITNLELKAMLQQKSDALACFESENIVESLMALPREKLDAVHAYTDLNAWLADGGAVTMSAFLKEPKQMQQAILRYIDGFWIYDDITVNGTDYFIAHAVPSKEKMQNMEKCTLHDFMYGEAEYEKTYFPDKMIITGHTPTKLIDEKYAGKIFREHNHIALDCGAVFGGPLGCIRLDDGKEFYVE